MNAPLFALVTAGAIAACGILYLTFHVAGKSNADGIYLESGALFEHFGAREGLLHLSGVQKSRRYCRRIDIRVYEGEDPPGWYALVTPADAAPMPLIGPAGNPRDAARIAVLAAINIMFGYGRERAS